MRPIGRRISVAAAVLATTAGALAGCGGSGGSGSSASAPIVICGDLALSGPYAQIGETDNWGATAFFKHVNATGGILGHKVKYTVFNNQSNAAQSGLIARKCIQQKTKVFIAKPPVIPFPVNEHNAKWSRSAKPLASRVQGCAHPARLEYHRRTAQ